MPRISETALTGGQVKAAKPQTSCYEIRDSVQRGLILRVYPSGRKMFIVQLERGKRHTIQDATLITVGSARDKARDFLTAHGNGESPESRRGKKATLDSYLSGQYMDWVSKQNRYGARDTRRLISALGDLKSKKLNKLSQLTIENWKRKRDVAPATVNREMAHLKAALNRAVEWGLIATNPAAKVRRLQDKAGKRIRWLTQNERKRLEAGPMLALSVLAFLAALVGARGLSVLIYVPLYADEPWWSLFALWERGGMVMYGGLFLAAAAGLVYVRLRGLRAWDAADTLVLAWVPFIVFLRIGCFLNGCCYGRPTTSVLGMVAGGAMIKGNTLSEGFKEKYFFHSIPGNSPIHSWDIFSLHPLMMIFRRVQAMFQILQRMHQ